MEAPQQLDQWKQSGEWTLRDTKIVDVLGAVPAATTRQLAMAVFGTVNDSGLVRIRKEMRKLAEREVVLHDRFVVGHHVGRPEDIYRLAPDWAMAFGYDVPDLSVDRLVNWFRAERLIAAWQWCERLGVLPPGQSQADWQQRRDGDIAHYHVYEYVIASLEDARRLTTALVDLLALMDAGEAPWDRCGHGGTCRLWFVGWDVELTFRRKPGFSPWMDWMKHEVPRLETIVAGENVRVLWEVRTFFEMFFWEVDQELEEA